MDYDTALKKVRAEKPKDNYLVLEFSYDNKIVLPHKDGTTVIAALLNAERLKESYGDATRIEELERSSVQLRSMSHSEYERIKVAALLNITPAQVKEMLEAANNPTPTTP